MLPLLEVADSITEESEAARNWEDDQGDELRPLDTPFQEESKPAPRIMIRKDWGKNVSPKDPNPFNRDRIFAAVASGKSEELEGLAEYLQRNRKFLSNSEYRDGKTGKTCLMKALLNLKDVTNPTVALLLKIDHESGNPTPLVNAACTDSYYQGNTALHIAIEKRSLDLVKLLVENGANVHARASGEFFHMKKRGVCFYFGELPLSLAACTNQLEVVQYLLDNPHQKANLTATDTLGNTVLHALVMVANDTEKNTEVVVRMYDDILLEGCKLDPQLKLEEIENNQGLTPLKLAAKTGKVEIFKHLLQREIKDPKFKHLSRKFTEWTYGPVHVSLYDLSSIDSYEKNSVLEILAYSSDTPNRYKMVVLEPLNKLLQCKWDSFASRRFNLSLLTYLMFMVVFTGVACWHAMDRRDPLQLSSRAEQVESAHPREYTAGDMFQLIGLVIVLVGTVYLLIAQTLFLWRRRLSLKSLLSDDCIQVLLLVQSLMLLISVPLYFMGMKEYVPLMVFSLLLGWMNLLYYTRGFQLTGIYSVMIQKTILRDLRRFLSVYLIFLFGFAVALFILTSEGLQPAQNNSASVAEESKTMYTGLFTTSLELFKFTIGMGELEFHEHMKFNYFVIFLLLLFVILTYILLLNMLIALMSETVNKISGYSQSVWKLQRAVTILEIEKNWLLFWKKPQRSGCLLPVGSGEKDKRWVFRVEEINWANWEKDVGVLNEDPGSSGDSGVELQEKSLWSWVSQAKTATPTAASSPEE
ncbi:transient receptor potential cation channel subfamily V member 2 [Sphaerodactylus townsendi]|uniref:transient receptor potential cation channel subfamily V member 2 n=1 Tax=Sphaerodactylus townsendi TaxID=933632 RepID=UPI00202748BA|nr:transient receptor potential cation channel subfamily V member 2 [Sphaerodactylus townsendi]XP_048375099.1 transient receptor potential cation channel subfamily V member 2 [Sphaerodactylus townsendi]XP_048375100.1 transient receptor potential cation channel subfamily V member 2 [Sphaerodactylus townsendi]